MESHCCHCRLTVIGADPLNEGSPAVSVCPSIAVPEIVAVPVWLTPTAWTTPVGSDVTASTRPPGKAALLPVTTSRIVCPTSLELNTNVVPVAPTTSTHAAPAESQRSHCRLIVIGGVPENVGSDSVNVCPSPGVPKIFAALVCETGVADVVVVAVVPVDVVSLVLVPVVDDVPVVAVVEFVVVVAGGVGRGTVSVAKKFFFIVSGRLRSRS